MIEGLKTGYNYLYPIIGGVVSCGLIPFYINRRDANKKQILEILKDVLQKLSELGVALDKAKGEWCINLNKLTEVLKSHIENIEAYHENIEGIVKKQDNLKEKYCDSLCIKAPTCPKRITGDIPQEFQKNIEEIKDVQDTFTTQKQAFINKSLNIINSIDNHLEEFNTFLNLTPQIYTLPKKYFNKVYPILRCIDKANQVITTNIRLIRNEPEKIGGKDYDLLDPLLETIALVEEAKLDIHKIISKC